MKKFLFATIALIAITFSTAQTVTPRWGNSAKDDNTFRALGIGQKTVTPTGTLVTIAPGSNYLNLVTIASTSLIPTFTANVTKAYFGDKIDVILLANSTASRLVTFSTNIVGNSLQTFTALSTSSSTFALPASKKAAWGWIFDGAKYVETYRFVEP